MTTDLQASFNETLRLDKLGLLAEAEASCTGLLRRWPDHVEALRLAARIAYRQGRPSEAADFLARAAQAAPSDLRTLDELARLLISLRQPAGAIPLLQRVLAVQPQSVATHYTLGIALRDLESLGDAEAAFRKAIDLDPRCASAYDGLIELMRRQGRLPEAHQCIDLALHHLPDSLPLRVALGDVLAAQRDFPAAAQAYRRALDAGQSQGPILSRLGVALKEMGDSNQSLDVLRKAVSIDPGSPEAHYFLGEALLTFGHFEEALESVREAARLRPNASTHELHGAALVAVGDTEGAIAALRAGLSPEKSRAECIGILGARLAGLRLHQRALECFELRLAVDPTDLEARHFVAALGGSNPAHPSPEYVRQLFEGYAPSFEQDLVKKLAYSGPREIKSAALSASTRTPPWDILDLGCGTGLIAAELAQSAASIVGVDLSPRMIESARQRRVYSRLICDDLFSALRTMPEARYDLVTAGDVLVYIGKLDSLVPLVRSVLRPHALFIFTTEAAEASHAVGSGAATVGYQLGTRGRYVHTAAYLSALAASNEFEVKSMRRIWLRLESNQPVAAWLGVWAAAQPGG